MIPFLALFPMSGMVPHGTLWLAYASLPLSLYQCRRFILKPQGRTLNGVLKRTAQTQFAFGCLLCVGLIL